MKMIYLDNGATTRVDPAVLKAMQPYFLDRFGNPSSTHSLGQEARRAVEDSRHVIARSIGAKDHEIVFTSGGTESNNLALKGIAFANRHKGNHIVTTRIEHDCVLNSCRWLESQGFKVTYLPVDSEGFVAADELEKAVTPRTIVVSVIHGNNEIGTIQDLKALGTVCRKHDVYFHTDACQSYTKTALDVKKQKLNLVTLNAHKIHGPKGVGALYVKKGVNITPLAHGGNHEHGLRSGTENVHGIVGFAKAVRLAKSRKYVKHMTLLRNMLIDSLLQIPDTRLNGPKGSKRLCNNVNVAFSHIEGEAVGGYLDVHGICSSTGSACSSRSLEPSHVLSAIGLAPEESHGSLRLTLSRFNTRSEIEKTLEIIPGIVRKLRKMSPLKGMISRI
ncbi:aminotransferase class V-fold PLP-dependent enzyme [Candidatus Woesearchaeota archaeon]|nr:aminotransferase class V-fold PLP-dependent enzyme [Candidatus Woesearchaeota archaeon]